MRANPTRAAMTAVVAVLLAVLAGCAPHVTDAASGTIVAADVETNPHAEVPVVEDIVYGTAGGERLLLDACLPPEFDPEFDAARAALVVVHGGSWTRGSKNDRAWRAVCQWLAASGYPTFNLDYRLAPAHPFPAAIDDVERAVEWLREPAQLARFGVDPARLGAFGGSAGGNLVSLLGTRGTGPLDRGTRVAAVAEFSAPIDLTGPAATSDFVPVQLSYLGCADARSCRVAAAASPHTWVDASDPPFFIAHSRHEMIPLAQAELFDKALRDAGVATTLVTPAGSRHSIAMLDEALRGAVLDFFATTLADIPDPV